MVSVKRLQERASDPNDWLYQSIQFVNKMRGRLVEKYGVSERDASDLIVEASEYNPRTEDEAYAIIHRILKRKI